MLINVFLLVLGLILIIYGANILTDGASAVAQRFGISKFVIGLTIVAFGTSAPELIISLISSINGSAELSVGNVVGSNIFNILLIIGVTSIIRPIKVENSLLTQEIPLVVLSSLAIAVMSLDMIFDGATNVISRSEGIVLLLFFMIFMRFSFAKAKTGLPSTSSQSNKRESDVDDEQAKMMPMWKAVLSIVGGLAGLIFGGDFFVDGASGIAKHLGVSQAVIGLTIVACGTSLPELATSVVAAAKKQQGIAVGNVVGSCLFNIFFILGCSATANPLPLGDIGVIDLSLLVGSSLLFWLFGYIIGKRTFTRAEGLMMTFIYVAYIVYLVINAT